MQCNVLIWQNLAYVAGALILAFGMFALARRYADPKALLVAQWGPIKVRTNHVVIGIGALILVAMVYVPSQYVKPYQTCVTA
jgi:hypothetical protein